LEVGAGGGSVAEWLCAVVGTDGHVVATDLETKFLQAIDSPVLEVREHNIVSDPLECEAFDLIHSRAVLAHLPQRDEVLRRLVESLKPGGWLVLIGADLTAVRALSPPQEDASFFDSAFLAMLDANRALGFDPSFGARLHTLLQGVGLSDVVVEEDAFEWNNDHPVAHLYTMTFQRLKQRALDMGLLTPEDHDRLLGMMAAPGFVGRSHTVFAARGRKIAAS
jgi:trans-aconitate methyltransferase